jgi:hypothetical protein
VQNKIKDRATGQPIEDPVAKLAFDLRTRLAGLHMSHSLQILEILEWVCGTDRMYDKARAKALRIINDEERAIKALVTAEVMGRDKEKETAR